MMFAHDIIAGKLAPTQNEVTSSYKRFQEKSSSMPSERELTFTEDPANGIPECIEEINGDGDCERKLGYLSEHSIRRDIIPIENNEPPQSSLVYVPSENMYCRPRYLRHEDRRDSTDNILLPHSSMFYKRVSVCVEIHHSMRPQQFTAAALHHSHFDCDYAQLPFRYFTPVKIEKEDMSDSEKLSYYYSLNPGDQMEIYIYPPKFFYHFLNS
jgi:hypothetical protein